MRMEVYAMKQTISLLLCALFLCAGVIGCGEEQNSPRSSVSLDEISAAISAEMKKELMEDGSFTEEDFAGGGVPNFDFLRLSDAGFALPVTFDRARMEDALLVQNRMNVKSDLIVVLKAKDDADVPELENYAKALRDAQYKTWERYLPDQFEKVQQNVTKTVGRYVIYVTCDEPQRVADAVENLLR